MDVMGVLPLRVPKRRATNMDALPLWIHVVDALLRLRLIVSKTRRDGLHMSQTRFKHVCILTEISAIAKQI